MKIKRRVDRKEFYNKANNLTCLIKNIKRNGEFIKIGDIYNTKSYGELIITEYINQKIIKVKFIDTGYVMTASTYNIRNGIVKDYMRPKISSVGYLGDMFGEISNTYNKSFYRVIYKTWSHMIDRCYNENCKNYHSYGGRGVVVDERWYNFSTFFYDYMQLTGYNTELFLARKLELDKDILQQDKTHGIIYSKETCCLVTHDINIKFKPTIRKFLSIHIDEVGSVTVTTERNMKQFADENGFSFKLIYLCLSCKRVSHKGYRFLPYNDNIDIDELSEYIEPFMLLTRDKSPNKNTTMMWKEIYNKYVTNLVKCND